MGDAYKTHDAEPTDHTIGANGVDGRARNLPKSLVQTAIRISLSLQGLQAPEGGKSSESEADMGEARSSQNHSMKDGTMKLKMCNHTALFIYLM